MPINTQTAIQEIDQALEEWHALREKARFDDCSDQPEQDRIMVTNRLASTIDRLAWPGSLHKRSLEQILAVKGRGHIHLKPLVGVLSALWREYELGHLQSFAEIIHADTFASFIEMANHLRDQGYKDPAAVIVGSVLEQHLRELCDKNQIAVEIKGKHKKADTLNAELAGQGVYSKLDQKNVTSWLGLRNDAAHGNYGNYTAQQVQLMIDAVRDFLARYPA